MPNTFRELQVVRTTTFVDAEMDDGPISMYRVIEKGSIGTIIDVQPDGYMVEFDPDNDGGGWTAWLPPKFLENV